MAWQQSQAQPALLLTADPTPLVGTRGPPAGERDPGRSLATPAEAPPAPHPPHPAFPAQQLICKRENKAVANPMRLLASGDVWSRASSLFKSRTLLTSASCCGLRWLITSSAPGQTPPPGQALPDPRRPAPGSAGQPGSGAALCQLKVTFAPTPQLARAGPEPPPLSSAGTGSWAPLGNY